MNMTNLLRIFLSITILLTFSIFGKNKKGQRQVDGCPTAFFCITTYVSEDEDSVLTYEWNKTSIPPERGPKALDKILIATDGKGKHQEVAIYSETINENVFYTKAIWKGKQILISKYDLDISKKLRTINTNRVNFFEGPTISSKSITYIPINTTIEVLENSLPISNENSYIRTKFLGKTGWIPKKLLSDDEYGIRYFKKSISEISKLYVFSASEKQFKIELKIIGDGFQVSECLTFKRKCNVGSHTVENASFGKKQEAVYFQISAHNNYVCEIRREDILYELQRLDNDEIKKEELDPFMNCMRKEETSDPSSEIETDMEKPFDFVTDFERRTLNIRNIKLFTEPNLDANVLTKISPNTFIEIVDNQYPSKDENGFFKIKYNDFIGWIPKDYISDDQFDIKYHKKTIADFSKKFQYISNDDKFKIELRYSGGNLAVSKCLISKSPCKFEKTFGISSFGIKQEAAYFNLKSKSNDTFLCEVRREDLLDALERYEEFNFLNEPIKPFMNCKIKNKITGSYQYY